MSVRRGTVPSVASASRAATLRSVSATSLSATVPSLQAAGRVRGTYFDTADVYSGYSSYYYGGYNRCYYGYGGYPRGYCYDYGYRYGSYWGLSVGFGYPYWGLGLSWGYSYYGFPRYSYAYYGYPYWGCYTSYPYYGYYGYSSLYRPYYCGYRYRRVSVTYPYVGYYYVYPYPYLDAYSYYDCDFYGSYYVRFGPSRTSYCVECSGYGSHSHEHHHCHVCDCAVHGKHYYHVRDCALCYPSGGGGVYSDVEVPEVAPGAEAAVALAAEPGAVGSAVSDSATSEVESVERIPLGREEAFFASLKPAQLSFATGLLHMEHGDHDEAVESFYSSSLEDPGSDIVKLFLGISLVSAGEFTYAAEYIRLALEDWDTFPAYAWNVQDIYASPEDYREQITLLKDQLALNPSDPDVLLCLGILQFHGGDLGGAARSFVTLQAVSVDAADQTLAARYQRVIEERLAQGPQAADTVPSLTAGVTVEDDAVQTFLAEPGLETVTGLPIR